MRIPLARQAAMVSCLFLTLVWMIPQAAQARTMRLSGPMPVFGQVLDFRISADNRYVVYIANQAP